jgi:hypothetical protein
MVTESDHLASSNVVVPAIRTDSSYLRKPILVALQHNSMPHPPHPLATVSQILLTPSAADGVSEQLEDDLRVVGCMLIQEAGILLDL